MKAKNLILLLSLNSLSYLYAAENTQNLSFTLDHKLCFTSYNSNNMNYYKSPQEFFNKNIFAVLPFDGEKDKENITQAFAQAAKTNKITSVSYSLDGNQFITTIRPLKALDQGKEVSHFFIEVMTDISDKK